MFPSFKLVLLVTALTCVWAQNLYEERKTNKKSRAKPVAANIHNGQAILDEDCSLELSFLLDSSESAKDNHKQEKQFSMNMVDRLKGIQLPTGQGLSLRVALLQYSSHVIREQTFKDWRGTENFKTLITPIIYIGHGTYTTYAITNMTRMYLEETSPSSIKVAVLLTDGISHPRNPDIFSAVADAKNQGIKIFTLGITRAANEPANVAQLRRLASSPASHFLYNLQDEDVIQKIVTEIKYIHDSKRVLFLKCPLAQKCACEKGERGPSGPAGKKGRSGEDGAPGLRGQKGEAGLSGLPGKEAAEGERGECGTPGIKGDRGPEGPVGTRGPRGLQGLPGPHGDVGPEGHQGKQGERGTSGLQEFRGKLALALLDQRVIWDSRVEQVLPAPVEWANTALLDLKDHKVFKGKEDPKARGFPDQRESRVQRVHQVAEEIGEKVYLDLREIKVYQESRGPQEREALGSQGDPGSVGLGGLPGLPGEDGAPGQKGEGGLPGLRGAEGAQGIGIQGEKGDQGLRGIRGLHGPPGISGPSGPKGERGLSGQQGMPGQPGRSISGPKELLVPLVLLEKQAMDYLVQRVMLGGRGLLVHLVLQEKVFKAQRTKHIHNWRSTYECGKLPIDSINLKSDFRVMQDLRIALKCCRVIVDHRVRGARRVQKENWEMKESLREDILKLIKEICGCGIKCKERPMELVFVIDSSESVGPENFEIIKDFVTRLVDRTTVGRNATRIGLVLYSLDVHLEFNLVRYMSKQEVKQAIRKISYMGEGTYTGTAIRKATQEAFFSARPGVRKVAIVITDGQTDNREPVKLDIAVREAHAANIEMYALGIVNSSDPTQAEFLQELNLIASDPDSEHMYLIDDFNTLPALESKLVSQFCEDENGALIYNRLTNGNWNNGHGHGTNGNNGHGTNGHVENNNGYNGNNGYVVYNNGYGDTGKAKYNQEENPSSGRTSSRGRGDTFALPISADPLPIQELEDDEGEDLDFRAQTRGANTVATVAVVNKTTSLSPVRESSDFNEADPRCNLTLEQGTCRDYTIHWYYDMQANACAQFWYGGCGGNDNRYETEDECKKTCVLNKT
ncbi:hypothetical protein F7725_001891, partial [Dissostichus mawsoni]